MSRCTREYTLQPQSLYFNIRIIHRSGPLQNLSEKHCDSIFMVENFGVWQPNHTVWHLKKTCSIHKSHVKHNFLLQINIYEWVLSNSVCMFHSVSNSSRISTDASPTVCLPSSDDLKLDRKRRQQLEQDQFVEQLKEKQLTNGRDLQSKSLLDKNTGVHNEYLLVRCRWKYKKREAIDKWQRSSVKVIVGQKYRCT